MSWSLKKTLGHLTHTEDDHLAHCQPCSKTIPCAYYQIISSCLNVDVCGLRICDSCMVPPFCGFRSFPPVQRPREIVGLTGRHRLDFNKTANGNLYIGESCRFATVFPSTAYIQMDGWNRDVIAPYPDSEYAFTCSDDGLKVSQPYTAYLPRSAGGRLWPVSDTMRRVLRLHLRFMLVGEVLSLGVEISTDIGYEVDYILFRSVKAVPEGWLDESGVPTTALTLDNQLTCDDDHCGQWLDNADILSSPMNAIADPGSAVRAYSPYFKDFSTGGILTANYYSKSGRFVVAVGGQVTIGSSSAITPCEDGSDCTDTAIDITTCNSDEDPTDPDDPPSPIPDPPPVTFPYRAIVTCGTDEPILGYLPTSNTGELIFSFDDLPGAGGCYQLQGGRLLLERDPLTVNNMLSGGIHVHDSCEECWYIRLTNCEGGSHASMLLSDFNKYGPIFRDRTGTCWFNEDDYLFSLGGSGGVTGVPLHATEELNFANSFSSCELCLIGCEGDSVMPNVNSSTPVWFGGGADYPAGTYTVSYMSGAIKYQTGVNWFVNSGLYGFRILHSSGAGDIEAPGLYAGHTSVAEVEADNKDLYVTFTHTGGPIGMFLNDSIYTDNEVSDPAIEFCLS